VFDLHDLLAQALELAEARAFIVDRRFTPITWALARRARCGRGSMKCQASN
jgi:hypothetical protein